jgi:hypothetical protein
MSDEQTKVEDPLAAPPPPPATPDEPKPERRAKPQKRASTKVKTGRFRSKVIPFYHPYQKVTIPVSHAVPLEVDNWVEVQVAAGVIEEA